MSSNITHLVFATQFNPFGICHTFHSTYLDFPPQHKQNKSHPLSHILKILFNLNKQFLSHPTLITC